MENLLWEIKFVLGIVGQQLISSPSKPCRRTSGNVMSRKKGYMKASGGCWSLTSKNSNERSRKIAPLAVVEAEVDKVATSGIVLCEVKSKRL